MELRTSPLHVMQFSVFDNVYKLKILDTIIEFVLVNVVNLLTSTKLTAKMLLHNPTVFKHVLRAEVNNFVASCTYSTTLVLRKLSASKCGLCFFMVSDLNTVSSKDIFDRTVRSAKSLPQLLEAIMCSLKIKLTDFSLRLNIKPTVWMPLTHSSNYIRVTGVTP